ncbi:hypothetical protein [Lysinibacillus sp. 54212]|uniref:hypothetical protein n=1 Tax=Lysinibacillus sp. 54212 TaxID=3119829 RepID=UPI002FCAD344
MTKAKVWALRDIAEHKESIIQKVQSNLHKPPQKKKTNFLIPVTSLIVTAAVLFFVFMLVGDKDDDPQLAQQGFMETVPHPESTEILYEHKTDDYEVIFYTDESGFRIGYKPTDHEVWTHTGNGEENPEDGFEWVMDHNHYIPVALFGGIITDEKITSVKVMQQTLEQQGTVFQLNDMKVWYAVFDTLESGTPDPLKIEAYNDGQQVVWRHGIYDNGLESGLVQKDKGGNISKSITIYKPDETVSYLEKHEVEYSGDGSEASIINFIYEQAKTFNVTLNSYSFENNGASLILDLGEGVFNIQGSTGGSMFAGTINGSFFEYFPALQQITFTHNGSYDAILDHFMVGEPYKRPTEEQELTNLTSLVFSHLYNGEYEKLSAMVDPSEGLTFSLFADFGNKPGYGGDYVNLKPDELVNAKNQQIDWGHDDSNREFKMTLEEYVQTILLKVNGKDFVYDTVTFNGQAVQFGGVLNTIHANYPNAKYIEYYSSQSSQALRFIFHKSGGGWYLIGIARDVPTG